MTDVQRSLVLVKPDGVRRGLSGEVWRAVAVVAGFAVAALVLGAATLQRRTP